MPNQYLFAAELDELKETNTLSVTVGGHTIVLFNYNGEVYAVDNRCPHMGFPLDRGTVKDGILTCHWHHARFDLCSGGTFDQWADDVATFPVEVRDGEIWVDVSPQRDPGQYYHERLQVGMERNISLVIAKSVIHLLDDEGDPVEPFRIGLDFGTRYRAEGWGQGLTILTCMMRLIPFLNSEDRSRALYHGLSAVASNSEGSAPRFPVRPLPETPDDLGRVKQWFRQFIEVRDGEGAERCIVSAVRAGADHRTLADMFFSAATDHRYIQIGHVLDFTNKAFEALDIAGWTTERAEMVLSSLVNNYIGADRMEESSQWRYPVDLVEILTGVFAELPDVLKRAHTQPGSGWAQREALVEILLSDDPGAIATALLNALRDGVPVVELAGLVTYAAARRIAHFHTSNDFGDWDTALHTFTFANAVQQGLRRVETPELVRGIFDAAISVYLDRFLNIPSVKLPSPNGGGKSSLPDLENLLNQQQQVNEAAKLVMQYLSENGDPGMLMAQMGHLLLRENRDFHTIQTIETAFTQYKLLKGTPEATHVLIAASRYLAAHAPTMRSQEQVFTIARRLHRGEKLFEEA